jgi:hypothetical protein
VCANLSWHSRRRPRHILHVRIGTEESLLTTTLQIAVAKQGREMPDASVAQALQNVALGLEMVFNVAPRALVVRKFAGAVMVVPYKDDPATRRARNEVSDQVIGVDRGVAFDWATTSGAAR